VQRLLREAGGGDGRGNGQGLGMARRLLREAVEMLSPVEGTTGARVGV
jgi:hypothetical protein